MDRDYLATLPDVTKVRATIKMNNVILDWTYFEINSTNTQAADAFHVEVPLYDQTAKDLEIVMDTESLEMEIAVDDGKGTLVRIMLGMVDKATTNPIKGCVTFVGRDLTSVMMDAKAIGAAVVANLTASELAKDYADEHKLKSDIQATTTLIGLWDGYKSVTITGTQSEWDVLCKLAQNENYDLYVKDDTLHFKPKTTTKDYYKIDWDYADESGSESSNALEIELQRNYTIANDIKVVARTRDILNSATHSKTYHRKHTPQRSARSKTQTYYINTYNNSPNVNAVIAQSLLAALSAHERKINLKLVGDSVLTNRSIIKVTGVHYGYDQLYYPDSIKRSMSFGEPFIMEVTAKNHSVNTQVS